MHARVQCYLGMYLTQYIFDGKQWLGYVCPPSDRFKYANKAGVNKFVFLDPS